MTIKRILVPLAGSARNGGELETSLAVARALDAHVEALFISEPLPVNRAGVSSSDYRFAGGAATAAQINPYAEMRQRYAQEARTMFMRACTLRAIPVVATDEEAEAGPAATWREVEGSYVSAAVRRAPAFDLTVAGSAAAMEALRSIAEHSLLETRRPVLLAPRRLDTEFSGTAMIAWSESPECWHAVSAAMPFLKLASEVHVVSVDIHPEQRADSQAEVLTYLCCHGIGARATVVAPELRSVGDTLLATAEEQDVGLIVMGAYSHSRLREMLMGGVTHHVLNHAATRPVLMAH